MPPRILPGEGDENVSATLRVMRSSRPKALELAQHLRPLLGRDVQVVDIYRFPTAPALASFLTGGDPAALGMRQAQQRAEMRRQLRSRA